MFRSISPTRVYVAMCYRSNFIGVYFRKFTLPEHYTNDSEHASWYFLNHLDFSACLVGCFSIEDYLTISDANQECE